MKKNPNYWDADSIKLDGIKFNLIEDANAAYSAYQTGECQMIKDVPTEEIPSLKDSDDFHVEPIIGTYYLSLRKSHLTTSRFVRHFHLLSIVTMLQTL